MTDSIFRDTMADMKWTDITQAAADRALVLVPIGVIEEHGPHLCLGTDIYTAVTECRAIRDKLESAGRRAVIAPPAYWGVCQSTGGFPGSFRIREETAQALMYDILDSLAGFGFTEVCGLSAHGDIGNAVAMMGAFREAHEKLGIRARFVFDAGRLAPFGLTGEEPWLCVVRSPDVPTGRTDVPDVHAGDMETAVIYHYYPELADVAIAREQPPVSLGDDRIMQWLFGGHTAELSPGGYLGAPADYAAIDAERHVDNLTARIAEALLSGNSGADPA